MELKLEPRRHGKNTRYLASARQQAEELHAQIEAQGEEATDHQHAKLAALYMLIYDIENPDDEELY